MMASCTKSHALIGSCVITFSTLPPGPVLPPLLQSLVMPVIQVIVYCFLNNLNF